MDAESLYCVTKSVLCDKVYCDKVYCDKVYCDKVYCDKVYCDKVALVQQVFVFVEVPVDG
jgi:hypothetical protein